MHLISGVPAPEPASTSVEPPSDHVATGEIAALKTNIVRLEQEVAQLRATLAKVCAELGIASG
jgi:uncharacterized protein YceH (UPF0502 family)